MSNIIDLAARLALHESVRPFLTILSAAPEVAEAFPHITKDQQRALLAVVSWRIMGAELPASIELLKRLPVLHGLHPESIQAAFMQLCEADVLVFQQHGEEGSFVWPALDRIIFAALEEAKAPRIVGTDGSILRG
jgi:hypothetical protein